MRLCLTGNSGSDIGDCDSIPSEAKFMEIVVEAYEGSNCDDAIGESLTFLMSFPDLPNPLSNVLVIEDKSTKTEFSRVVDNAEVATTIEGLPSEFNARVDVRDGMANPESVCFETVLKDAAGKVLETRRQTERQKGYYICAGKNLCLRGIDHNMPWH